MKLNSEQDIDRILTALRNTEAPTGLDHRILTAIEHRATPTPTHSWLWSLAALTTAAIIISAVTLHQIRIQIRVPHSSRSSQRDESAATKAPGSATPHTSSLATISEAPPLRVTHLRDGFIVAKVGIGRPPDRSRPSLRGHRASLHSGCDPIALAESQAPSHPAPELPLTDQEKLLRRIARHPDPVEIAELDPSARAARAAEDKDAFKNFFNPPETETNQ